MTPSREIWPNFFLAGAPKAGTTALYRFLGQHPDIYLSSIKEPTFFAGADLLQGPERERVDRRRAREADALARYLAGPMTERLQWRLVLEREQYLKLFERAAHPAVGEGSVSYFFQPGAPAAIAAQVPHARLVFILRDPAERIFSEYLATTYHRPEVGFRERFQAALDPANRWSVWLRAGRYAENLQRFFDRFPREQILIALYEDFRADPAAVMRDLFTFLGVNRDVTIDPSARHNQPAVPRFPALHRIRRSLFGSARLTALLPRPARRWVERLYHRPRQDLRLTPSDRQMMVEHFHEEIERTARLIGRDLTAWLR